MKIFFSLRNKLTLLMLVTTFSALAVAGAMFLYYDLSSYRDLRRNDMATQIELLSYSAIPSLQFDDARVAVETLNLLKFRPTVRTAAIYSVNGSVFAKYRRAGAEDAIPVLPETDGMRRDGDALIIFKRIIVDGQILGTAYLNADYLLKERIMNYLFVLGLVTLVAMAVSTGFCLWIQAPITRPILSIAAIAREVVTKKEYSRRATKISADEVGDLVENFNGMLDVIEQRTAELEKTNAWLADEVVKSDQAKEMIEQLNVGLETKVRERTVQLEATNGELESFCYSVSHDLRGPLRAISGFSQALAEELPQELPGDAKRYLDKITAATTRMGQLIEDLLNLSRVSRGELKRQRVNLSEMAKDVITELRQISADCDTDVSIWDDIMVEADPKLLRIVLDNLLSNAWKFSSKQQAPKIVVGVMEDSGQEVCFIRDNGAGFDMKYADKLFGAFQRLHAMHEYPGTGVGLATVKRIVNRHGGRIWFNSTPGKGAIFCFTLKMGAMSRIESPMGEHV